jgi:hypothetical protein
MRKKADEKEEAVRLRSEKRSIIGRDFPKILIVELLLRIIII